MICNILDDIVLWLHKTFPPSEETQKEIEILCEDTLMHGLLEEGVPMKEAIKHVEAYRSIGRENE
jgi:hypothetical protein